MSDGYLNKIDKTLNNICAVLKDMNTHMQNRENTYVEPKPIAYRNEDEDREVIFIPIGCMLNLKASWNAILDRVIAGINVRFALENGYVINIIRVRSNNSKYERALYELSVMFLGPDGEYYIVEDPGFCSDISVGYEHEIDRAIDKVINQAPIWKG